MRWPAPRDLLVMVTALFVGGITLVAVYLAKRGRRGSAATAEAAEGSCAMGPASPPAGPERAGILYSGEECPICLSTEAVSPVQTNCGHWYCARCILQYYNGVDRARIKCPMCRQEVNMLHGSGTGRKKKNIDQRSAWNGDSVTPETTASVAAATDNASDEIARFNERNSGRQRTLWQVLEDAPLLLRRLWSDLRRGDTRVFGALIRGGVMLQLFVVALYIVSPVDFLSESLLGMLGLVDDALVGLVFLVHITVIYRTILLSWDSARVARAAHPSSPTGGGGGDGSTFRRGIRGAGAAAGAAVAVGAAATAAGVGAGAACIAATAVGMAAAAVASSSRMRAPILVAVETN